MTTGVGRMASKAFELDTPEIPKAGFNKIRGLNPQIAGIVAVPSCIFDEAGPMTASNARTRGANPPLASGTCPFLESNDPESANVSTISSMTTEKEGVEVALLWHFSKYSSQSFLDPTDIAL